MDRSTYNPAILSTKDINGDGRIGCKWSDRDRNPPNWHIGGFNFTYKILTWMCSSSGHTEMISSMPTFVFEGAEGGIALNMLNQWKQVDTAKPEQPVTQKLLAMAPMYIQTEMKMVPTCRLKTVALGYSRGAGKGSRSKISGCILRPRTITWTKYSNYWSWSVGTQRCGTPGFDLVYLSQGKNNYCGQCNILTI